MARRLLIVLVAPLIVLGTVVHAQDVPATPAGEVTAPAQTEADPVKKKEVPATEVPVPANDETAATSEKSPAANEETAPAEQAPAPTSDATTPATDTVTSAEPESAPATESNVSSPEAAVPAPENVATVPSDVSAPATDATAPVADTIIPAPVEAAPAPEPAAPAEEAVTQVAEKDPAPVQESPAPMKEEVAPVAETTPAEASPVPVAEIASTPDTAAPAPEAAAPIAEAVTPVAPAADTIIPSPVEPAPAPEAVAAAPEAPVPVQDNVKQMAQEEVPVQEAPAAIREEVAPVAETAATLPAEAAPVPDATIPSLEAVTPATETVTQVAEETPAPVSETPAPTAETPALAADATLAIQAEALPAPESVTPAPEAAAPPAEEAVAQTPTEAPAASQEPAAPVPTADYGVAVDRFAFSYGLAHPALPSVDELNSMSFPAARDGNVYRGAVTGGAENLNLGNIPVGSRFDADALRTVAQAVVSWYNNRGLYGVWVTYRDIEASAAGLVDNRSLDDARVAHLVVWASQIADVRTLARGKRIKPQFSIMNRKHRGIIKRSPLKEGATADQPGSLFNQEVLNEYLYSLNHPGRRVEASIASYGEPGKVVLDYLINESKAWQLFAQVNNYGTEQTGTLRGRVGYQDNQLTNHDDILNIDLISTKDLDTYGAFISYRIPLWRPAKLLMRVYGSYGDYLTEPTEGTNLKYAGDNFQGGIEFMNRLTLFRSWQFTTVMGANYTHYGYGVKYGEAATVAPAESDYMVPFVGTTVGHDAGWWAVTAGLRFDHTVGNYANMDPVKGYQRMGRANVDRNWTFARWNINGALFLDRFFNKNDEVSGLSHELTFRARGRHLLRGKRVPAQEQEPVGGALSVRGYQESVLAADETLVGSIEYAYHIPLGLQPAETGTLFNRPFRWHPTKAGQNPDWDLAVRAFFDYGHRGVSAISAEGILPEPSQLSFADTDFDLSGAGVGLSFSVKQNLFLRADLGMALTELKDSLQPVGKQIVTSKGNKQLSVVSTFIW